MTNERMKAVGSWDMQELCLAGSTCSVNTSVLGIAALTTNSEDVATLGGEQRENRDYKRGD